MFRKLFNLAIGTVFGFPEEPKAEVTKATNYRHKDRGANGKFVSTRKVEYTGGGYVSSMPVKFGLLEGVVSGGPFRLAPPDRRVFKISLAPENGNAVGADFVVPTVDFGVPDPTTLKAGLMLAMGALAVGRKVYVGCGYGQGRTGTFLACLAKIMYVNGELDPALTPVKYVRETYNKLAVETQKQEAFIDDLDVSDLAKLATRLYRNKPVLYVPAKAA